MNKGLRSTFSSAGESPGFLLYKASNLLLRLHGAALKEFDLTPAQFSFSPASYTSRRRAPSRSRPWRSTPAWIRCSCQT